MSRTVRLPSAPKIEAAAKADAARKIASKESLRASRKQERAPVVLNPETHAPIAPVSRETPKPTQEAVNADREAWLATLRIDYDALKAAGVDVGEFDAYVKAQEGPPEKPAKSAATLSMAGLHVASKHYVRGIHNGDFLAAELDTLTRAQVIDVLGSVLLASGVIEVRNPYSHLNPGQQSMNLRNKFRGACKNGLVSIEAVKKAIAAARA